MGNREFLKQLFLTNINLSICKIKAKRKILTAEPEIHKVTNLASYLDIKNDRGEFKWKKK